MFIKTLIPVSDYMAENLYIQTDFIVIEQTKQFYDVINCKLNRCLKEVRQSASLKGIMISR